MKEETYALFVKERKNLGMVAPYAKYDWLPLDNKLPFKWMVYSQFLDEHSRELANSINELNQYLGMLMAWQLALPSLDDEEKNQAIVQHVSPITTLALLMPYAIRSRFIYSIAHLSNQANRLKDDGWKDDIAIDRKIYFQEADRHGAFWKSYKKLKVSLEKVACKRYTAETMDFRNSFSHRYSPRIEIGITGIVTRIVSEDGRVSYGMGETQPLMINDLVPILKEQHGNALEAYDKYIDLVGEQATHINEDARALLSAMQAD